MSSAEAREVLSRDGQKEQALAKQNGDQYFEYWRAWVKFGGKTLNSFMPVLFWGYHVPVFLSFAILGPFIPAPSDSQSSRVLESVI